MSEAGISLSLTALTKFKSKGLKGIDTNNATAVCYDVEQGGGAPSIYVYGDGDFPQAVHHASIEITQGSGQIGFGERVHMGQGTHHLNGCFPRNEADHSTGIDQEVGAAAIGRDNVGRFSGSRCQGRAGDSEDAVVVTGSL